VALNSRAGVRARGTLPPAALARALPLAESMRTEVTAGQYLDILAQSVDAAVAGRLQPA
jgi:hypothetical protein